jgi:hypothetical protein
MAINSNTSLSINGVGLRLLLNAGQSYLFEAAMRSIN